jgi:hypothetical protein
MVSIFEDSIISTEYYPQECHNHGSKYKAPDACRLPYRACRRNGTCPAKPRPRSRPRPLTPKPMYNLSIFSLLAFILIKAKSRNIEQKRVEDFSF